MLLTYRFKLAPTKAQYAALAGLCEDQRRLYNAALQERIEAWKKNGISISKIDQNKSLTIIRSFDEAYSAVPVAMSRWFIWHIDITVDGRHRAHCEVKKDQFDRLDTGSTVLAEVCQGRISRRMYCDSIEMF